MKYKGFKVIGGGIYGCHISLWLMQRGEEVALYEREASLMSMASGNNQFRLHLGFHYARNSVTRRQSKIGFEFFMSQYSNFTLDSPLNLYVVPSESSLIDYPTYISIFKNEGFDFDEMDPSQFHHLMGIEGAIHVKERIIDVDKLRQYFTDVLRDSYVLNNRVDEATIMKWKLEGFFVIDCTWGARQSISDYFYEVTHLVYVQTNEKWHPAITLVDGPLWSLYPTATQGLFTLSHVRHTPLEVFDKYDEALCYMNDLSEDILSVNYDRMINDVIKIYPSFVDIFTVVGHQRSIKRKPRGLSDPRDCRIELLEDEIRVQSGKIDTMYVLENFLEEKVLC
jgi:FAD dependent oxidoreductase